MNISTTDARPLFTKMLIDVYREMIPPTEFLRSFFPTKLSPTKEVAIEVQRGFERVAVDVIRGTEGNRNNFAKSTEKVFVPPFYREYFDATELALYDRLFGSTEIGDGVFAAFIESVAEKIKMLQEKIQRAYEVQCAQVLLTGVVTLNAGINIDFKRKALSLVDVSSSHPWSTGSNDPNVDLITAAEFLRSVGKAPGGIFNCIMGTAALQDFLNNTSVQNRGKIFNYALDTLQQPQRDAVGASYHGEVAAGAWRFRVWTYPQYYDVVSGTTTTPTYFIPQQQVVIIPENPKFVLAHAAVPQLLSDGQMPIRDAYVIGDYIDERKSSHIFDIKSAGVAVPVAVDQIYTLKVTANSY